MAYEVPGPERTLTAATTVYVRVVAAGGSVAVSMSLVPTCSLMPLSPVSGPATATGRHQDDERRAPASSLDGGP